MKKGIGSIRKKDEGKKDFGKVVRVILPKTECLEIFNETFDLKAGKYQFVIKKKKDTGW